MTLSHLALVSSSICCSYLLNAVGRKWSLLIATITGMVGWMMIAFATSKQVFAMGRYMAGISTSFGYISAIIYVGETSPANVRGISTSTLIVAANIGMYIKWTISSYLSTISMVLVSTIAPILLLLSISWAPESPYFLMQRGKHLEAILSLVALRESADVGEEADTIERSMKTDLANTRNLCETGNRKALITVLSLMVIEQWSGQMILWDTFISITHISSGTLGIVKIIFIFLGIFAMDSYGRRPLLTISSLGISVSTFLIGLFLVFQNNQIVVTEMPWLLTMGVVLYLMMCAFGLATLPFTMMSEVFPMNIKIDGSGISMLSRVCCMCILEFFFPFITYRYGIHVMCWIFSIISLWSALFVYWYTPETMGKTLQEVEDLLHKRTSL
ncbi:uncharacterized protein LOC100882120 isoform X2 [Megachile rotundata]|uniref:uncharacterized protein LOC100882120 isoform X2 n=1 Tax=Megachile rotundata TaxID=143995 RepID=UPI003FD2BD3C